MGKEEKAKKELMGKVYREFSRQKYNNYKHKYPKMRESEIVSKIIKEWDALTGVAKTHLQKVYEKNKCLTLEDISSSEQLMRAELQKKEALLSAQRSTDEALKSASRQIPVTRMFPPPSQSKPRSDSDYNRDSNQKDDSKPVESSSPKLVVAKTKPIKKDYITFYREKYNRLHSQHPRWTPKQISSIIKLEWKKDKQTGQKVKRVPGRAAARMLKKALSGYCYYRKYRGLTYKEAIKKWVRFPRETRNYWTTASSGIRNEAKKDRLNLPSSAIESNKFLYLKNKLASK